MKESVVAARSSGGRGRVVARELDVLVDASRMFGSLIASTLARLDPAVTMPQWRVLVLCASPAPVTPSLIAEDLSIHPSNATRIVDRVVAAGLVRRVPDEVDRRQVRIELTAAGETLFRDAMALRRVRLEAALRSLDRTQRTQVADALRLLTGAMRATAAVDDGV